jgi:hypothetical protein
VSEVLRGAGACFFPELVSGSGLSIQTVEDALGISLLAAS